MKKIIFFSLALLFSGPSFAQVGIGTTTPASSAILDLTSTSKGFLLPRVANTAAVTAPVNGLMIYDLSSNCLKAYQNGTWSDCLGSNPLATSAVCIGFAGSYCTSGLSNTTYVVTITNNDYTAKQVTPQTADLTLSGITGVNVSAVSPNTTTTINAGASLVVTYTLTGIPVTTGTLTGTFNKQGMSCSSTVTVGGTRTVGAASSTPTVCQNSVLPPITHTTTASTGIGTPTGLPAGVTATWAGTTITISGTPSASGTYSYSIPINGCGTSINATGTITVSPTMTVSTASSTPETVNYVVMNNITHTTINATGIGTATGLPPGVSASWVSNTITIGGIPIKEGTYNYSIPLTGCGTVNATGTIRVVCRALVASGVYKNFMCYNLGATNTTGNPNTPVQGIYGNYYQWGSAAVVATASTTDAAISGWNTIPASNYAWSDSYKTPNDPCPSGYRVPTQAQWYGVTYYNSISRVGTWTDSSTNYSTGINFGPGLFLPAAGYRHPNNGTLYYRGSYGYYWSSTEQTNTSAYDLVFSSSVNNSADYSSRLFGWPVRCIAE